MDTFRLKKAFDLRGKANGYLSNRKTELGLLTSEFRAVLLCVVDCFQMLFKHFKLMFFNKNIRHHRSKQLSKSDSRMTTKVKLSNQILPNELFRQLHDY